MKKDQTEHLRSNPSRHRNDDDDIDMVVGFDDIMSEEKHMSNPSGYRNDDDDSDIVAGGVCYYILSGY
nr:hypothetical protein [Tanacetum cinerariifolium]